MELHTKLEIDKQLLDLRAFHNWAGFEIKTQNDATICGERLAVIATHRKQIELQRDKVLKPLKQAVRAFEDMVREALRPLNHIDELLRHRLASFMDAQHKQLEAEAAAKRAAELAAEKSKAREAMALAIETGSAVATEEVEQRTKNVARLEDRPIEVRQTIRLEGATVSQMRVWEWSVADEAKIPREFFILDEKKLNAIAKSYSKNPVEVPGITFEQKTRLSVAS